MDAPFKQDTDAALLAYWTWASKNPLTMKFLAHGILNVAVKASPWMAKFFVKCVSRLATMNKKTTSLLFSESIAVAEAMSNDCNGDISSVRVEHVPENNLTLFFASILKLKEFPGDIPFQETYFNLLDIEILIMGICQLSGMNNEIIETSCKLLRALMQTNSCVTCYEKTIVMHLLVHCMVFNGRESGLVDVPMTPTSIAYIRLLAVAALPGTDIHKILSKLYTFLKKAKPKGYRNIFFGHLLKSSHVHEEEADQEDNLNDVSLIKLIGSGGSSGTSLASYDISQNRLVLLERHIHAVIMVLSGSWSMASIRSKAHEIKKDADAKESYLVPAATESSTIDALYREPLIRKAINHIVGKYCWREIATLGYTYKFGFQNPFYDVDETIDIFCGRATSLEQEKVFPKFGQYPLEPVTIDQ